MSLSPATSKESKVRDFDDPAEGKRSAAGLDDQSHSQSPSAIISRSDAAAIGSMGQDGAAEKDAKDSCPMDDLPDEVFAPILDMCEIRQLFVLMSVSKRWQAGCGYVIRSRESLIIGRENWYHEEDEKMRGWDWHRERPSERLDRVPLVADALMPVMLKSLNRSENLKRLCLAGISPAHAIPFILQLADKLTMLSMDLNISEISAIMFPRLTQLHCLRFDAERAGDLASFPKLAELVIDQSGEDAKLQDGKLSSLKRLLIIGFSFGNTKIRDFIEANAMSLEFLAVGRFELELHRAVVFPNLTELHFHSINGNMAKVFPAIRRLTMYERMTVALLERLPAAQMLGLNVKFDFHSVEYDVNNEKDEEEELEACAAVIGEMINLTELSITVFLTDSSPKRRTDPSLALSRMFARMHQLEKVSITVSNDHSRKESGQMIMSSLVQQNANLRHVYFSGINITAAAYQLLAQLHHLSHITLDMDRASEMTTDGVVTLLRGSSRRVIRMLKVCCTCVEVDRVTREVELMAQERGVTFEEEAYRWGSKDKAGYLLEYKIHA